MSDSGAKRQPKPDWVTQIADRVVRRFERQEPRPGQEPAQKVVCASGISPSGPIHLGNLRELMVPHYVTEEIRSRGIDCVHLHSWDDYDRLRKVPAGIDESFAQHIGRPLSEVPDPEGTESSWAERFKAPLREAMERLGVELREVSQSEMYGRGAYRQQIITALSKRGEINEVLARYRTLETQSEGGGQDTPATEAEDGGDETSDDYWPYKVYCQACGLDLTTITGIEPGETSYWLQRQRRPGPGGNDLWGRGPGV